MLPLECYGNDSWELLFQPRQRTVKTIAIYNEQIFIGTGGGVLVSSDGGNTWKDFGTTQLQKDINGNTSINWTHINDRNIYIATSFGAYISKIDNPKWEKIFESTKTESSNINSLTISNNKVYLTTNDGFWICYGNECNRLNKGLEADNDSSNYETFYALDHKGNLFLGTSNGIYNFNEESISWHKISDGIQGLPDNRINARHLLIDKEGSLWAACGTGVYFSQDHKTWEKISNGIKKNDAGFQEAYYFFQDTDKLYVACASGIYYLEEEEKNWKDFSFGIRTKESSKNVYWLEKVYENYLAATDEGLFIYNNQDSNQQNTYPLKGMVEADFAIFEAIEPSVIEVQKQALRFASLPTTKDYKKYRTQARLRNLFPRISFDINTTGTRTNYYELDKGISTNIALNNAFDSGRTTRLERDGRSFKQLGVFWNTDQLIYDNEIVDILNHARLSANIKENLLDDVTRIYFQRKRMQLGTLVSPPNKENEKLAKNLEIAELTGQLDSRTGGWFSKEIERRKRKLQKTKNIWEKWSVSFFH